MGLTILVTKAGVVNSRQFAKIMVAHMNFPCNTLGYLIDSEHQTSFTESTHIETRVSKTKDVFVGSPNTPCGQSL